MWSIPRILIGWIKWNKLNCLKYSQVELWINNSTKDPVIEGKALPTKPAYLSFRSSIFCPLGREPFTIKNTEWNISLVFFDSNPLTFPLKGSAVCTVPCILQPPSPHGSASRAPATCFFSLEPSPPRLNTHEHNYLVFISDLSSVITIGKSSPVLRPGDNLHYMLSWHTTPFLLTPVTVCN